MPQAQWVLDAAYTAGNGQSSFSGPPSPQRLRRGNGVLHLDLRGVPAGPGTSSPAQPASSGVQWKPPNSYKPPGPADSHAACVHQPYSALLLSVLNGGNNSAASASPGARASGPAASNAMTVLSPGCTRGPVQPSCDPMVGGPPQPGGQRPPHIRPAAPGGFTVARATAGQAAVQGAAASLSAGGAVGTSATARPNPYNPLLPRQGARSAGRRGPSTGPTLPEPPYTSTNGQGSRPPSRGSARQRQDASNDNMPYAPYSAASRGATDAMSLRARSMASTAASLLQRPNGVAGSSATAATATAAGVSMHGCHPEDLMQPMTAAMEAAAAAAIRAVAKAVQSPNSTRTHGSGAGGGGGGGSASSSGGGSGGARGPDLGAGPAGAPRSHFEVPLDRSGSGGGGGGICSRGESVDLRSPSPQGKRRDGMYGESPSQPPPMPVSMQTALAVLSTGAAAGTAAPPPAGAGRDAAAAATSRLQAVVLQPTAPPATSSSASSCGLPARVYSPVPRHIVRSSASGTDDSALDFFGMYEGDVLSVEEGGGDDEDDDEEEGGEDDVRVAAGRPGRYGQRYDEAGGGRLDDAELRPWRVGSGRGVRSTANVHAVRAAAAATVVGQKGRATPTPPHRQQQQRPVPWPLQRPPSGRPPAAPPPPGGGGAAAALRRRSSFDASSIAAAATSLYGRISDGLRENSASEAGSRPGTASSAWSAYDMLLSPDLKPPPGRGQSLDNMPAAGDGGAQVMGGASEEVTAAAGHRRAASNPRDATRLECRSSGGKVPGPRLSRSSSSASCYRAAGRSGGGGSSATERTAVQALALLATLALTSPPSPGGASFISGACGATAPTATAAAAAAAGRKRAGASTGRGRKTGGGSATPHRPLHPAVLALAEMTAAPYDPQQRSDEIPTDEKGRAFPYIQPPAFPGTCPTIAFVKSAAEKHARGLQPLLSPTLYVKYGGVANTPVRTAFREAGLRPTRKGKRWIVQWGGILDAPALAKLHSFQRVNHFPGTWELGHKGHLYRNVYNARRRARGPAAEAFDIVPRFYIMPRDYEEFKADVERFPDRLYIQKPTNSSRGRGIRMVTRPDAISRDAKDMLVQHYIANPLLLNGFKFDMRVYAAATCLDPLRLYVFPDGLARLATEPYSADKADLTKRCVHLTNYSVNKKSAKFVKTQALLPQPHQPPQPQPEQQEPAVCDIVAAAVIAAEPRMNTEFKMKVPHRNNCFEVWGFDIMLTDVFRAWLIEANTCPSLAADSGLDMRVKCSMVSELMHLIGPVPYDVEVYEKAAEAKRQARLTGLPIAATNPTARSTAAGGAAAAAADEEAPPTPNSLLGAQPSFGQSTSAASGGGGGGGGGGPGSNAVVQPKSLHELDSIDFTALNPAELPEVVLEAEAEMARKGSWERVFPCEEDPARYLNLFETPRLNNIMLCKYYAQTSGNGGAGAGGAVGGMASADPVFNVDVDDVVMITN
ncbi:hypothetical protein VOLCADRAFT_108470 [Volvox carteri f. nagariensis]|uniref:Tubulin--tyrosine ligase-like protein 9 n=1 Tax=Volvox carteri f. nagariensis TaxID=3068 RepID=D8UKB1_VOLCA|nr:uncharacterized protein VOLCADRAFT_108470 [Volvox carteri f. nagariensis]EFJ39822.1 hypothetical protein VOLCADRAFT_108470 [Volvox carteri f. nagariensis]|eukprot:XP_002959094.1 hypothetical protein VOLCADRAFT_108470 [Volvox carteri f. nagariensis]